MDSPPANPAVIATPITRNIGPSGSAMLRLESENAGVFEVRGRIVAVDLPCSVRQGCGGEHTMTIVRCPVFGLNLPGEQIVGMFEHCTTCGPEPSHTPRLVTPTQFELDHNWAPGTVG